MNLLHANISKRARIALVAALVFMLLIGLLIFVSETSVCIFLRGTCSYDPRTEHLNSLFMEPPEPYVVQYIED